MAEVSGKDKHFIVNYLTEISATRDCNLHLVKWNNTVLLRNCTETGKLVDLRDSKEIVKPWVQLCLKSFHFEVRKKIE